jgi:RimJ/RimL family protein N-acetyltransferase
MIKTERLILRQWKESDSEPFIKMGLDEDVMRFSQLYLLLKV